MAKLTPEEIREREAVQKRYNEWKAREEIERRAEQERQTKDASEQRRKTLQQEREEQGRRARFSEDITGVFLAAVITIAAVFSAVKIGSCAYSDHISRINSDLYKKQREAYVNYIPPPLGKTFREEINIALNRPQIPDDHNPALLFVILAVIVLACFVGLCATIVQLFRK